MSGYFNKLGCNDLSVNSLDINGVGNVGDRLLSMGSIVNSILHTPPTIQVRTDLSDVVYIDVSDNIVFCPNAGSIYLPHPSDVSPGKEFKICRPSDSIRMIGFYFWHDQTRLGYLKSNGLTAGRNYNSNMIRTLMSDGEYYYQYDSNSF